MPIAAGPFAAKKFATVNGRRMAYVDEGDGDAIVFQHGNPTSSYLWRNVMPHCAGLGRLIACDLIGMGDSDKLPDSGPQRYTYAEQREYLFALWDRLDLGRNIIFVIHDWGSALGFEWANRNRERVAGIAYMEALVTPVTWADWPENARRAFQGFRSEGGEDMILQKNMFVERVLPGSVMRKLSEEEMAEYRRPFLNPGEDRRPTLTWPRQIPIEGEPADVVKVVEDYSAWLATSDLPKLFINAEPGSILVGRQREICRALAEPDRSHREGPALPAGRLTRRDRPGGRRVRAPPARVAGWLHRGQHVDHPARHHVLGLRPIGLHVRRDRVRLEVIRALPFLDHHERVRAIRRRSHVLDVDRRAVFDAAGFGEHGRPVRREGFEHGGALAGLGGDDGDDVDHGLPPGFLNSRRLSADATLAKRDGRCLRRLSPGESRSRMQNPL